jgi:DNA-binding CsgD family transcriptional regulator
LLDETGLHIIGRIYDSALGNSEWNDVLGALADYCGGENVALAVIDQHTGYSAVTAPRADPLIIKAYEESWWQLDPTAAATGNLGVGQITSLRNTGRDRFLASPFYNEFWKQSGLGTERLASNLAVRNGFFASAVLQTSAKCDEIDAEMERRFRHFVPHLIRSIEMENHYRNLQYENLLAASANGPDMIGRLIVDSEMHLIFADSGGEAFVTRSGCFKFRRGTLGVLDKNIGRKLAHAVASAGDAWPSQVLDCKLSVVCPQTQETVSIDVQPVHPAHMAPGRPFALGGTPAAILNLSYLQDEKQKSVDKLRSRFGLTPAEAALAFEMLKGDGREAAAKRCGISINTARTHLTRIFDKTGVKRQAELIALVNGLV